MELHYIGRKFQEMKELCLKRYLWETRIYCIEINKIQGGGGGNLLMLLGLTVHIIMHLY